MKFKIDDSIVNAFTALTIKFQVNERIFTTVTSSDLLDVLESQFNQRSESIKRQGNFLTASNIEASFGSINRTDVTEVSVQPTSDGFLIVANVKYRPSLWFWIISILLFFTWILWLVPIAFFLIQKKTVKEAIEDCFRNTKNEVGSNPVDSSRSISVPENTGNQLTIDDIERLGNLLKQGLITQQEFDSQKAKLFGLSVSPPTVSPNISAPKQSPLVCGDYDQEAKLMFNQAREYARNGKKDDATETLRNLIRRFPETKLAGRAKEILTPRTKAI